MALEGIGRAEFVTATATVRADITGVSRLQSNTVVDLQPLEIATCGYYHARGLMGENEGLGDFVLTELSMLPVMNLHGDNMRESYSL